MALTVRTITSLSRLKANLAKVGADYSPSKNTTIGIVFTGLLPSLIRWALTHRNVLDSAEQKVSYFKTK